jgi:hypothetical protein
VYYLAKATKILSSFGWGIKNSKDLNGSEIAKEKIGRNDLIIRRNLETEIQTNNPNMDRVSQAYIDKGRTVKFKEERVKEFKNFQKIKKENVKNRKSSSRRLINIENPIPNQNATVGKPFELTINGTSVFSSNSSLFLEATNVPIWLTSYCSPVLKGSYGMPDDASGIAISENYAYIADSDSGLLIIDISDSEKPLFKGLYYIPGSLNGVVLFGNYAYVSVGRSGLQIIDISNPVNLTFTGSYDTSDYVREVALAGNYAYVIVRDRDYAVYFLHIVDITNPSNPTFRGSYDLPGEAWGVAVSGNYAYVASRYSGLQIIDISNPSNPTFKGSYDTNDALEIALSSNYAYVVDNSHYSSGLQVIDISDPSNPTLKGSYYPLYAYSARGVVVSENYAYVVIAGLHIIDISDPSNPTFKGSYNMPGYVRGVAVSENYAYVASSSLGLQIISIHSDKLTLSGMPSSAGIDSVDVEACNEIMECVSDSFDIMVQDNELIVTNPIPDQNATVGNFFELTIDRTFVFSSSSALFEATNIPAWLMSTPLDINPTFKGSFAAHADGIAIFGNYAYVADWGGLQIIDISNPAKPTLKGLYSTSFGDTHELVVISGNYAYMAAGSSGLQIVDISDPANPTFKGSCNAPDNTLEVAVSGNYAYLANKESGLHIIDTSTPSNPTLKGSYDTPDLARGVALSGNYAYVADWTSGLQIIDISDPSNSTFKGSYDTPGNAWGVTVSENYAYVADGNAGLQIIDIADPSNPTFKGSYDTPGYASGVALSWNYAYIADGDSGLLIVDITDPSNPTFKDSYDMPGRAYGVALSGNYAYVAADEAGLQIIALNFDKQILSGTPSSLGTYGLDIEACNEAAECVMDSFDIIVKDIDDTTDTVDDTMSATNTTDLTNSIVIISAMSVAACVACIASFFLSLIIGGVILMIKRNRNKILENENNADTKELKEKKNYKK